jgi:hypothetical protein
MSTAFSRLMGDTGFMTRLTASVKNLSVDLREGPLQKAILKRSFMEYLSVTKRGMDYQDSNSR